MRPTFMGFETARRGLSVFQKGLDITGQNMTNVNTPGYTRQRMDVVSVSGGGAGRFSGGSKVSLAGQGAMVSGIAQVRDQFLDKRFREEYADVGYYDKTSQVMENIEASLDEVGGKGLGYAIEDMWKTLKSLQENLDQSTNANIVMTSAKNMSQILSQFSSKLDDVMEQQKFSLTIDVNETNAMFEKLANLNLAIKSDISQSGQAGNYGPNELLDQRNLILDDLGKYGDLSVKTNSDGTITVDMNGHTVVNDTFFETINVVHHQDNTSTLKWLSTGGEIKMSSGSLNASLDMINGRGSNVKGINERYEKGIPYYKDKIDAFAVTMSNAFNSTIVNTDGTFKTLFASGDGAVIDASNIQVSDIWANDPAYIIKDVQGGDGYDNKYIAKLITLFDKEMNFAAPGEAKGEYNGTMASYVTFYNGTIGQQLKFNNDRFSATAAIADDLLSRRDSVMGIVPDEEATALMTFQKAYTACSRLMTTLDEALDILINRTGRVGL